MGIIGDIVGGFSNLNAQRQAGRAADQDQAGLNSVLGTEQGAINNILQNFFGPNGAESIMQHLGPMLMGQLGQSFSSPYSSAAGSVGGQLQNFNGLKPQELAGLQTTLGNNGMQTINTLRSQLGGTANPGATIQGLMGQNQQNVLNSGVQLGSMASGQELGALQSAGSLFSGMRGQDLGYFDSVLRGLLSNNSQQSGLLGSGLSSLSSVGNAYAGAGQNAANAAAAAGQAAGKSFGNAGADIAGLFTGGAAGAGGIGSLFG